jgi:hypothetical protein
MNMSSMKFTTKMYKANQPAPKATLNTNTILNNAAPPPAPMLFNRQVNSIQTIMSTPKTGCGSCGH